MPTQLSPPAEKEPRSGASSATGSVDVSVDRVTKRFGDTIAVNDLTLDVEHGEFFSLLGPSGCGKTTTLAMIGGFELPSAGTVSLAGVDVSRVPPYRRDVNTVFQSYALFPHLDVFGNVAFGLRRRRASKAEIARRVTDALRLVDLPGYEARKPSQLSGGQQQRVALARALINEPRVLLLDEPLGALDLKLRKQMQVELKRIQQEVGITFLYVTHDQEEAMTMSDRLAVMNDGRIEQLGSPEEVYERPRTEFVASFLGASNLLPGRVRGGTDALAAVVLDGGGEVRVERARVPGGADTVKVGVRPEKLRIESPETPAAADRNAVTGQVIHASFLGVSHQYTVECGGGTVTVYVQNLGALPPTLGQTVRLSWLPEHTFVV
jgi:spermidine/putrescine transport system ATP-binding protein